MGHAVYSLSDPREVVFKGYVEQLAHEKEMCIRDRSSSSMRWALQPMTRATANSGVYSSMGMPNICLLYTSRCV